MRRVRLIYPGYAAGAGDALAIALLVVVALAGFVFARTALRARVNPGWPGAAGLAVYVLYMLPVIAYGTGRGRAMTSSTTRPSRCSRRTHQGLRPDARRDPATSARSS